MLADLTPLAARRVLTAPEISEAAAALVDASVGVEEKTTFLRAWTERGETASEIAACAEAFLPHALDPGVRGSWNNRPLLDCCGTGGGGLNLLNISTGLMFILAALEIPVVKHGNRGLTKKSGSADVLEALGIKIDLAPAHIPACLEKAGYAFLFAPAYHPAFAAIAPARQLLAAEGRRTIFNLLGPLLNPARPDARLIGVFHENHLLLYREALQKMNCARFTVACGVDEVTGRLLGEVSANGITHLASTIRPPDGAALEYLEWNFADAPELPSLLVADAGESARRLIALLRGDETGLGREMLLLNAAIAAWTQGTARSLEEGLTLSTEALDSGRAYERLERGRKFSETVR